MKEINAKLEELRAEKKRSEPKVKAIEKAKRAKGTLDIKEKSMLYNTFENHNFDWIDETTKTAHFEHKKTKEVVYLLPNKQISIMLNPDTTEENLKAKGKIRHST
ncbi:MAG: hypothetical protein LRY71_16875, partial [Bacillaceae bacterium]|nr:hypothetical protein [Bacillaceae bacterium]